MYTFLVSSAYVVRVAQSADLPAMVAYLNDQLRDNGTAGTPLFQPLPRGAQLPAADKLEQFRSASMIRVGEPDWRRFWLATAPGGTIAGHIDLRAHPDASTMHRALLGMGVHRDHRRRGVGRLLLDTVVTWATSASMLDWIDLRFLAGNHAAEALYRSAGFREVGTVRDMFRIDGVPIDEVMMTKALRTPGTFERIPLGEDGRTACDADESSRPVLLEISRRR